jgi:hypothetical protein
MAWYGIDHSLGTLTQGQHSSRYPLIDLRKARSLLVKVIEGVKGEMGR